MSVAYLRKAAVLSDDRRYRYLLTRQWVANAALLQFVMLNPSTADEDWDDPTTRQCVAIAQAHDFGAVALSNLYAFRCTNPNLLTESAAEMVGDGNDAHIVDVASQHATKIVVAWGDRGSVVRGRIAQVADLLTPYRDTVVCLGTTASGNPRHPRFVVARASRLEPFDLSSYAAKLSTNP